MGSQNTRIKYLLMRKLWDHKILGFITVFACEKIIGSQTTGIFNICKRENYGITKYWDLI